ncbi:hypothetical protein [Mycolicibacterium confluentis]|uniref:hypothetical protein n=1 Tax=Mycolicibacterium confluentis TaxID=28047 RepID=UPI001A980C47|nr:hypothetical protein [Mycolicibacterium confluentis]
MRGGEGTLPALGGRGPVAGGRLQMGGVPIADLRQILEDKPEWLAAERESYQEVLREERRLKALRADKARES